MAWGLRPKPQSADRECFEGGRPHLTNRKRFAGGRPEWDGKGERGRGVIGETQICGRMKSGGL